MESDDNLEPVGVAIKRLEKGDAERLAFAFMALGEHAPASMFIQYFQDQRRGAREVLVAWSGELLLGYVTVQWDSEYPPFRDGQIPEIVDLHVLPEWRRQGVGSRLMDEAERLIGERSPLAGISVGAHAAYGPAQVMYVRRGYLPDGRGISYRFRAPRTGEYVRIDDGLALHFIKSVGARRPERSRR